MARRAALAAALAPACAARPVRLVAGFALGWEAAFALPWGQPPASLEAPNMGVRVSRGGGGALQGVGDCKGGGGGVVQSNIPLWAASI